MVHLKISYDFPVLLLKTYTVVMLDKIMLRFVVELKLHIRKGLTKPISSLQKLVGEIKEKAFSKFLKMRFRHRY